MSFRSKNLCSAASAVQRTWEPGFDCKSPHQDKIWSIFLVNIFKNVTYSSFEHIVFVYTCYLDEAQYKFYDQLMQKIRSFRRTHICFLVTVNSTAVPYRSGFHRNNTACV